MMLVNNKSATTIPTGDGAKEKHSCTTTEGKFCKGYKKKVLHKYKNCWELETNKDKRPKDWKSVLDEQESTGHENIDNVVIG